MITAVIEKRGRGERRGVSGERTVLFGTERGEARSWRRGLGWGGEDNVTSRFSLLGNFRARERGVQSSFVSRTECLH